MAEPELNRRSGDPSDIRRVFTEGDDERDRGLAVPEGLTCTYDIAYGPDATWNVLDVYAPAEAPASLPVIVSVHGGAWVYGDKERYRFYCMDLATRGFCVVNFSYRLAPEHPYPAAPVDACAALAWTVEHVGGVRRGPRQPVRRRRLRRGADCEPGDAPPPPTQPTPT